MLRLLLLRFEAGDIYPPYSSLRADPLGTKALYQSLAELPGVSVRRNYLPLGKLTGRKGRTLLYLGAKPEMVGLFWGIDLRPAEDEDGKKDTDRDKEPDRARGAEKDPMESMSDFVSAGGRLVISFSPAASLDGIQAGMVALRSRLGFTVDSDTAGDEDLAARPAEAEGRDPAGVSWHTSWYFKELSPEWRQVYLRDGKPVIIEREFRGGSVVIATDSYFLSNEAMLKERRPRLLAWLVGGREIVFDETHLGAVQEAGIATLARRYNLAGLFFVLVLLAALFVWKNAVPFLPRSRALAERLSGAGVAGRGSGAGLFNLLRRSISPRSVLSVCLSEWARSGEPGSSRRGNVRERIEAAVRAEQARSGKHKNPVAAYRSICRILSERK